MKAYGLKEIADPDVADIKEMGRASHVGKFVGKSGDYHPYCHGTNKSRTRRYWARKARAEGKLASADYVL